MKNQLLILTAVIGVTITGGITSTPILLPPAQAVTANWVSNGILVIGVGENVRGSIIINKVRPGTKFYFECKEKETDPSYDYIQISGPVKTILLPGSGRRTSIYSFSKKGRYSFNVSNITKSYNDTITVNVE